MTEPDDGLVQRARTAAEHAHAPRSNFHVGAAIETTDGQVYTGCNVGVVNYSGSLCAERVALFSAVADSHRRFARIAVATDDDERITPCGACRQALAEFCDDGFEVHCAGTQHTTVCSLGDLLPAAFAADL